MKNDPATIEGYIFRGLIFLKDKLKYYRNIYLPWTVGTRWAKVPRIDKGRVGLHVERTLRAHRGHRHIAVVQTQCP